MSLWLVLALVWVAPLVGLLVLVAADAAGSRRRARIRSGWCTACATVVPDLTGHLDTAHADDLIECAGCGQLVPAPSTIVHGSLFHRPRPRGVEDLAGWGLR